MRNYGLLFLFGFSLLNANQPVEQNLFFSHFIQKKPLAKVENKAKLTFLKEKNSKELPSNVFHIRNISEFLFLVTKKSLPLIINVYSHENINLRKMNLLSNKLHGRAYVLSIDSDENQDIIDLINLFIRFEGLIPKKLPFILFCKPNSMIFENNSVSFKKKSLKYLVN